MQNILARLCILFVICTLNRPLVIGAQNLASQERMNWDEFKSALMKRYDQKVVVTRVSGLQAGEKKSSFGTGQAGMHWHHFHSSVPLPEKVTSGLLMSKKLSDMQRLDDRTFGTLIRGVNTTAVDRAERLKVSKFYVYPDSIDFVLATTELSHMRDIDVAKANTERYGNTRVFHDFGLVFRFHFDKESILKAGDYQTVVAEIGKYLLPQDEAEAAVSAEKNIELEIGMPEESVHPEIRRANSHGESRRSEDFKIQGNDRGYQRWKSRRGKGGVEPLS
jgi:hypothetical protein